MSKTVLITGTNSGFGKLMVQTLAKGGHSVIAAMRNVNSRNAEAAKELSALHNVEVIEMDVTDETSVSNGIENTLKKYGHIDVLVNNAGVTGFGLFEATSIDQMKNIFEVNVWGTARTTQAVLPSMRAENAGLIINVTSGLGLFSSPFIVPYNMSKFALEGLTEGIRAEVRGFGIETVTVLPGPFPTEVASKGKHADKPEVNEAYGEDAAQAQERFGTAMFGKIEETKADPQEVADAVVRVIDMKAGERPKHTVVNRMGGGVEQEYADLKAGYTQRLFDNMGWGEFA